MPFGRGVLVLDSDVGSFYGHATRAEAGRSGQC
jgi:hypothetical protein